MLCGFSTLRSFGALYPIPQGYGPHPYFDRNVPLKGLVYASTQPHTYLEWVRVYCFRRKGRLLKIPSNCQRNQKYCCHQPIRGTRLHEETSFSAHFTFPKISCDSGVKRSVIAGVVLKVTITAAVLVTLFAVDPLLFWHDITFLLIGERVEHPRRLCLDGR
jgi:hypothetical protein